MMIDPWGEVLACASGDSRDETFVAADLDFGRLAEIREKLPSLQNRVPAAYRWPQPAQPMEAHA